jgi:translation elongation factor EF-Tu-like GTPase
MYFQLLVVVAVTGRIERGIVKVGENVEIVGVVIHKTQRLLELKCSKKH